MHFGGTQEPFRCMKVITKHHSGNVVCTCKGFRPEVIEPCGVKPDAQEAVRMAFEDWYSRGGDDPRSIEKQHGVYRLMQAQLAWEAWEACSTIAARAKGGPQ